jgi:hypothetical protein
VEWLRRLFGGVSEDEMEGLRLRGSSWELSKVVPDVSSFLRALPKLVPDDAILFLEGGAHPAFLRVLLDERRFYPALRPALGTIWPRQPTFALPTTPAFLAELARAVESCAAGEVCSHLHVYREKEILLEGYDAFTRPFSISGAVPERQVRDFCADLGVSWTHTRGPV